MADYISKDEIKDAIREVLREEKIITENDLPDVLGKIEELKQAEENKS